VCPAICIGGGWITALKISSPAKIRRLGSLVCSQHYYKICWLGKWLNPKVFFLLLLVKRNFEYHSWELNPSYSACNLTHIFYSPIVFWWAVHLRTDRKLIWQCKRMDERLTAKWMSGTDVFATLSWKQRSRRATSTTVYRPLRGYVTAVGEWLQTSAIPAVSIHKYVGLGALSHQYKQITKPNASSAIHCLNEMACQHVYGLLEIFTHLVGNSMIGYVFSSFIMSTLLL
jgi:hypothetical protein